MTRLIIDRMKQDVLEAMKTNSLLARDTLRVLLSDIQKIEKKGKTYVPFDDSMTLSFLQAEAKHRLETADDLEPRGQVEVAAKERAEAAFIYTYLPKQLTLDEVKAVVDEVFASFDSPTKSDFKTMLNQVFERVGSSSDRKTVSSLLNANFG